MFKSKNAIEPMCSMQRVDANINKPKKKGLFGKRKKNIGKLNVEVYCNCYDVLTVDCQRIDIHNMKTWVEIEGYNPIEAEEIIKQALPGCVREVAACFEFNEIVAHKDMFAKKIGDSLEASMAFIDSFHCVSVGWEDVWKSENRQFCLEIMKG